MTTTPHEPGAVRLSDPAHDLTADIVPAAGMIGVSLRHRGVELLGQRRGLEAYRREGKTMGIPLLYPWANRLAGPRYEVDGVEVDLGGVPGVRSDPRGLPIHGVLAACSDWTVSDVQHGEDGTPARLIASLDFSAGEARLQAFPFPHRIELEVGLRGGRLTFTCTVGATSDRRVPLAFGFHPYLTLPGVPREDWVVELPAMRHRPVDAAGIPTGEARPQSAERFTLGDRTFDDGYDELLEGAAFVLQGGGRRITTTFVAGFPAAQVFAPSGEALVCFEPMAAPTNALVSGEGLRFAEPGAPRTAIFSIEVVVGEHPG